MYSPTPADEDLAQMAGAIGHPARIAILRLLIRTHPQPAGHLVLELPWSQPSVSRHLKSLREAGLVRARPAGREVLYEPEPAKLRTLVRMLSAMTLRMD